MTAGVLRDADELVLPAVRSAIAELDTTSADAAVIKLCERYAAAMDAAQGAKAQAWAIRWIGPLLLDALEALGASPAARSKLKEGKPRRAASNGLAELRAARRA